MKKSKILVAIVIILSLMLSLTVLTACDGDEDKEWTININFETNNSDGMEDIKITIKEDTTDIDIPTPAQKAGYEFEGWYLDEDYQTKSTIQNLLDAIDGKTDITFYAKWEPNTNTLNFDKNGGQGDMDDITAKTDVTITLPKNEFTLEDHIFIGWALTADGEVAYEDQSSYKMGTESEYTLYAVWLEISNPPYETDEGYIFMGMYPQSEATTEELNGMSAEADEDGYYTSGEDKFVKYLDDYYKLEPIKWRVLKEEDGTALLLSEFVLDNRVFSDNNILINWETSLIREWLNNDFYNMAFSTPQKNIIQQTQLSTNYFLTDWDAGQGPSFGEIVSVDTVDRVFYLSKDEIYSADYGFENYENRIAYGTDYTLSKNPFEGSGIRYGLRSGVEAQRGDRIDVLREHDDGGTIMGTNPTDPSGVRPAIVIQLVG